MPNYDAEKMRAALRKTMGGRAADPSEFRPAKAVAGQIIRYKFFILPPVMEGDTITGGTASKSMETYQVTNGQHWVDKKPYGCPRVITENADGCECDMCQTGFSLKNEAKTNFKGNPKELEAMQAALSRQWLPNTTRLVNIWFPPHKSNPEELRDQVKWFKGNNTVADMWADTFMRDDQGNDEDEPLAFGSFFDETNAFLFYLNVNLDNGYNSYKQSTFLVKGDTRGTLACGPIVKKSDGSPDRKAIQAILDRRHDLYSKVDPYSVDTISKLAKRLLDASDGEDGFDKDETTKAKPAAKSAAKPAARSAPVVEEDEDDELEEVPITKVKPAVKKITPPNDDDDLDPPVDSLANESPLEDEDDDLTVKTGVLPKSNGKTAAPPKTKRPEPAPLVAETETEEEDPEVSALLGQLHDDD